MVSQQRGCRNPADVLETFEHGLAFDREDRLRLVNWDGQFYGVDVATGAATPLAAGGGRPHHGDFHPVTGLYWGIDQTNATASTPERTLKVVDLAAGTVRFGNPTADNLFAITFK